jgi:hypothetical protein
MMKLEAAGDLAALAREMKDEGLQETTVGAAELGAAAEKAETASRLKKRSK